jgi:hypothetical protein
MHGRTKSRLQQARTLSCTPFSHSAQRSRISTGADGFRNALQHEQHQRRKRCREGKARSANPETDQLQPSSTMSYSLRHAVPTSMAPASPSARSARVTTNSRASKASALRMYASLREFVRLALRAAFSSPSY